MTHDDSSNVARSTRKTGIGWHVAAVLLAAGHFAFLFSHFEPAIHQPDANGYFAQATHLAQHGRSWFKPASHLQYVGMHWLKTDDGRYFSHYPPGFSLILAAPFKLGGPAAAMLVNPLMCSLTILALYLLVSTWVGHRWGLLAAALMACNPVVNSWALGYFAHTATAFFLVWGLYFLARWDKTTSWRWALAAGMFLGFLPSVRYPAVLFCVAGGLFALAVVWTRRRETWRSALIIVLGMAVPICALLVRNHFAFGAFWKTGYSLTNEQTGFGWDYFTRSALPYIRNIQGEGAGLLFGLGLAGMAALCARRKTWRYGLLLAASVVPVTLLYMSYYWAPGGRAAGTMRFLLPTFYIYAVAAAWLLAMLAKVSSRMATAAGVTLLAVYACWGLPTSANVLHRQQPPGRALASITETLRQHVEPGSLVIANNTVQQHLDFVGRWKLVDASAMRGGQGGRFLRKRLEAGEDRPSPMQREKLEERMKRYEGLDRFDRLRQFTIDLWTWAGKEGKKSKDGKGKGKGKGKINVFWLVDEAQLTRFKRALPSNWPDKLITVATIELPKVEPPDALRARFGRRPGMPRSDRPDRADGNTRAAGGPRDRMRPRRRNAGPMGRFGSLLAGEKLLLVEWTVQP